MTIDSKRYDALPPSLCGMATLGKAQGLPPRNRLGSSGFLRIRGVPIKINNPDRPSVDQLRPHHPTVHLSIDVQNDFVRDLCPTRQRAFVEKIDTLIYDLRHHNIPTVHIGTGVTKLGSKGTGLRHHTAYRPWHMKNKPSPRHDLPHDLDFSCRVSIDEHVIQKHQDSCLALTAPQGLMSFYTASLHRLLKKWRTTQLIITGLHTSHCIASTSQDALNRGYTLIILEDHLADGTIPHEEDNHPQNHRHILTKLLPLHDPMLMTKASLLTSLTQPRPAQRIIERLVKRTAIFQP